MTTSEFKEKLGKLEYIKEETCNNPNFDEHERIMEIKIINEHIADLINEYSLPV